MPGAIEGMKKLRETYCLSIFSARKTDAERDQMVAALDKFGIPYDEVLGRKPDAMYYLDDKGVRFESWDKVSL